MRKISLALATLSYLLPIVLFLWLRSAIEPLHGMFVLAMLAGVLVLTLAASAIATALRVSAQRDLSPSLPRSSVRYRLELLFAAAPMTLAAMLGLAVFLGHAA
ncbi:MAG: hypothetical protein NVV60_11920 [Luteimonas sp.]|nr:hypothetical protein [Luteimonas sp.]